jgi:hypothetical protein
MQLLQEFIMLEQQLHEAIVMLQGLFETDIEQHRHIRIEDTAAGVYQLLYELRIPLPPIYGLV